MAEELCMETTLAMIQPKTCWKKMLKVTHENGSSYTLYWSPGSYVFKHLIISLSILWRFNCLLRGRSPKSSATHGHTHTPTHAHTTFKTGQVDVSLDVTRGDRVRVRPRKEFFTGFWRRGDRSLLEMTCPIPWIYPDDPPGCPLHGRFYWRRQRRRPEGENYPGRSGTPRWPGESPFETLERTSGAEAAVGLQPTRWGRIWSCQTGNSGLTWREILSEFRCLNQQSLQ